MMLLSYRKGVMQKKTRSSSWKKFKSYVFELTSPKNPLLEFRQKNGWKEKSYWSLEFLFPIVKLRADYNRTTLRQDLVAGVTIGILALLQGIGYAQLAHLPPEIGLYSSVVPPLLYALLCTSRDTIIGPSATTSLIMASVLSERVSPTDEPMLYLKLALTTTFLAGIFQIILGLLRLGFIMNFLSKATLTGFKTGTALLVMAQQLKQLLGIVGSTSTSGTKMDIFSIISTICERITDEEGIAVGRSFTADKNYRINDNREMIAMGTMNLVGSCSLSYITTGSFSRSAVQKNTKGQTAVSNVFMSLIVFAVIMLLMSKLSLAPKVILSTMIITAMIDMVDYWSMLRYWRADKIDFVACMSSFVGVVFNSMPIGLAIAVGVSLTKILLYILRPRIVVLGNIEGNGHIYKSLSQYDQASRVPELLILGIQSPIYFLNYIYVQERILKLIGDGEDAVRGVVLDMSAITVLDMSGVEMMDDLQKALDQKKIKIVLANAVEEVEETIITSSQNFGKSNIYCTIAEAVLRIQEQIEQALLKEKALLKSVTV
ncbi:Sulfate transporter 1.3 [Melia azedarach]|uniref:Sulfate transporter 1.3 n=1 Tax=Melia azedarach TaxID=155640 RepID=A0ACC1Y3Q1_MELAZ|nr:Sulfate transporter 1.3 [Melia azedarach]